MSKTTFENCDYCQQLHRWLWTHSPREENLPQISALRKEIAENPECADILLELEAAIHKDMYGERITSFGFIPGMRRQFYIAAAMESYEHSSHLADISVLTTPHREYR